MSTSSRRYQVKGSSALRLSVICPGAVYLDHLFDFRVLSSWAAKAAVEFVWAVSGAAEATPFQSQGETKSGIPFDCAEGGTTGCASAISTLPGVETPGYFQASFGRAASGIPRSECQKCSPSRHGSTPAPIGAGRSLGRTGPAQKYPDLSH